MVGGPLDGKDTVYGLGRGTFLFMLYQEVSAPVV